MWFTLKQPMEELTQATKQSQMAETPSWSSLVGIVVATTSQWWLLQVIFQVLLLDQLVQVGCGLVSYMKCEIVYYEVNGHFFIKTLMLCGWW